MGSLIGHVLPGLFFFLFGMWWCCNILQRYYLCRREAIFSGRGKKGYRYRSSLLFSCGGRGCCKNLPVEGILVVTATTIGFFGELATAFRDGKFTHLNNAQHMTMYFFFGLMGMVHILLHYRFALPPDLDYLTAILALAVQGFLFLYHLHGRTLMDQQIHTYLVYLILGCAVSGGLEMMYKNNVLPAICRAYFIVLQGTWFFQVGFILYPLPFMGTWMQDDHNQMMITTMIFTWHLAGVFLLFSLVGLAVNVRTKYLSRANVYSALDIKLSTRNGDVTAENVNRTSTYNGTAEQNMIGLTLTDSEEEIL